MGELGGLPGHAPPAWEPAARARVQGVRGREAVHARRGASERRAHARERVLDLRGAAADPSSAYKRWASSGARPRDIPRDPAAVYGKRGEWVSWDDFLGRAPGAAKRGPKPKKAHALESR